MLQRTPGCSALSISDCLQLVLIGRDSSGSEAEPLDMVTFRQFRQTQHRQVSSTATSKSVPTGRLRYWSSLGYIKRLVSRWCFDFVHNQSLRLFAGKEVPESRRNIIESTSALESACHTVGDLMGLAFQAPALVRPKRIWNPRRRPRPRVKDHSVVLRMRPYPTFHALRGSVPFRQP